MAHEVEQIGTIASLAYNIDNGTPWHRLGTAMDGLQNKEAMLAAAQADYEVHKSQTFITDPETGEPMPVPGKYATWRKRPIVINEKGDLAGGDTQVLGGVGEVYHVVQNDEALDFALLVLNETDQSNVIDVMGVLEEGQTFFANIPLPEVVIDPNGISDTIRRSLTVVTGHTGKRSLQLVNSHVRAVCMNTVQAALRQGQAFSIRHTKRAEHSMAEVKRILGLAFEAEDEFARVAIDMIGKRATLGTVTNIADTLWDWNQATASPMGVTLRDQRNEKLADLWVSEKNSAGFGDNGWAAWNTIVEYLDHHTRGDDRTRQERAALDTMARKKIQARELILA